MLASEAFKNHLAKHGRINKEDLLAISKADPKKGPWTQADIDAANYFLKNPNEWNHLDTAGNWTGGKADNYVSMGQLQAYTDPTLMERKKENTDKYGNFLKGPGSGVANRDLTMEELKKIAADTSLGEMTRMSAQYFIDHPEEYKAVFGGSTTTPGNGDQFGGLGSTTLKASDADTLQAAKDLVEDPNVPNSSFTREDLDDIATDTTGKYSLKARQAAQYLLNHNDEFVKIDQMGAGGSNGTITKSEMKAYLATSPTDNAYKTANALASDPMVNTSDIHFDDLDTLALTPGYSAPAVAAFKALKNNSALFKILDGADGKVDNIISKGALQNFMGSTTKPASSSASPDATRWTVNEFLSPTSTVPLPLRWDDLEDIASDPSYGTSLQQKAQYFLDHRSEFDQVAAASPEGGPETITQADLQAWLKADKNRNEYETHAASLMNDTLSKQYLADGGITKSELDLIEKNSTSEEAKAAARYFKNNLDKFNQLTGEANPHGRPDEIISTPDLQAALAPDRSPVEDANPTTTKNYADQMISWGWFKGPVDETFLKGKLDTGNDAEKKAAQYFLDHQNEFNKIDKDLDGVMSTAEAMSFTAPSTVASAESTKKFADQLMRDPRIGLPPTKEQLKAIMDDPTQNSATRTAARYFYEHPEQIELAPELTKVDGLDPGPETDTGTMNALYALATTKDIYLADGTRLDYSRQLSKAELAGIAKNAKNSTEVRQAALYLLNNPNQFDKVDTDKNGAICLWDAAAYHAKHANHQPASEATLRESRGHIGTLKEWVLSLPNDHPFRKGGISREQLGALIYDPNVPQDIRNAAHYLYTHDAVFDELITSVAPGPIAGGEIEPGKIYLAHLLTWTQWHD